MLTESSTAMDKLTLGLQTTAIGLIVVFVMLFVIIAMIKIISVIIIKAHARKADSIAAAKLAEADKAPAAIAKPAGAAASAPASADSGLIAAITAAIAVVTGAPAESIRLRSIKRTERRSASSAWARAARNDQIISKF